MPLMFITVIIGAFATILALVAMATFGILDISLLGHGGQSSRNLGVIGGLILGGILLPFWWLASGKLLISIATEDEKLKYSGR